MSDFPEHKYTVELSPKWAKRPITNRMLEEYVDKVKNYKAGKRFILHKDAFGNQGNVRFVHFFSDLTPYDVQNLTRTFATEKRANFSVRGSRKPTETIFNKGGIVNFLMQKVEIKEFKIKK